MTRTKALVVVGCIMLALAAMAVMELKQETVTAPAGQTVTGSMARSDAPRLSAEAPTAPLGGAVPQEGAAPPAAPTTPGQSQKAGELLSLEPGTLHPENTVPAQNPQTPAAPAPLQAAPLQAAPAPTPQAPAVQPEPARLEPVQPEPAKTAPVKTEPARTESAKTEPAKTEPAKTEPAKSDAAKTESGKTESGKTESGKTAAPAEAPKSGETRAIDTAGPVKVDAGQKAIVWTRMEISDKGLVFRMSGAEKLEAKAFVLPDPDRYVVDLQGGWAMRLPTVPGNAFLRKIRVGKQEGNTRLVLDLSGPRACQMVRINPTTLELRIK